MAFIEELNSEERGGFIFNVTHAVGSSAPNFWTDIMLVQYFISNIYLMDSKNEFTRQLSNADVADLPNPHTDFKKLKKTEKWIRIFQEDAAKLNLRSTIDGRVDRGRGVVSSITRTIFTIHSLNVFYKSVVFEVMNVDDPLAFALADPSMPGLLRGELLASG